MRCKTIFSGYQWLVVVIVMVGGGFSLRAETPEQKAKNLLYYAENVNLKTKLRLSGQRIVTIWRWKNNAGTILRRFEFGTQKQIDSIEIQNEEGDFTLYSQPKIAVRDPAPMKGTYFTDIARYKLEDATWNGEACFKISQTIPLNMNTFSIYERSRPKTAGADLAEMRQNFF